MSTLDALVAKSISSIPQDVREIAASEAAAYHAFMVKRGVPTDAPWTLLEIAFYSGFCKAFRYTMESLTSSNEGKIDG